MFKVGLIWGDLCYIGEFNYFYIFHVLIEWHACFLLYHIFVNIKFENEL